MGYLAEEHARQKERLTQVTEEQQGEESDWSMVSEESGGKQGGSAGLVFLAFALIQGATAEF